MDRYSDNSFLNNTRLVRKVGFFGVIILLIIISLAIYLFIKKDLDSEIKQELAIDSEEVLKTYGYFNVINSIYDCSSDRCFGFFLGKDKLEEKDMPFVYKAYVALNKYYVDNDKSIQQEINSDILDEYLKKVFGRNYTYDDKNKVIINGAIYSYNSRTGNYELQESGAGGLDNKILVRKVTKAYKTKKNIEVYEKIAVVNVTMDDTMKSMNIEVYNNNNNLLEKTNVDLNYDISTINVEKYMDKLDTYKWTFTKKFNGEYIFEKVEKQNN